MPSNHPLHPDAACGRAGERERLVIASAMRLYMLRVVAAFLVAVFHCPLRPN